MSLFTGEGETAALMRTMDWSQTPLGDPGGWSAPLRTMVSTCLASRYPMFLWWGPDLINLYNDAYAPLMGEKHPDGMGRPAWQVWAEIWDVVGPMAMRVLEHGEATWSEAQRLDMERSGYVEETYFDFAYSAVRDETGAVAGILGVVSEITERVLGARRLQTLSAIAARTGGVEGVHAVAREAVAALADNPHDLPFALLYETAGDELRLLACTGVPGTKEAELRQAPSLVDVADEGDAALERVLRERRPATLGSLTPSMLMAAAEDRPAADKALMLAVEEPGERAPTLALVCGLSANRALDDDLRRFCGLVAAAIGSAVAEARALEEERARAEALAELDRAKTEFFSNVSHEFRTPLTLLLGPLEDAVRRPDPDPELVMAHRNALRLLRHVNTLLEYSRLQAQRTAAHRRALDLAAVCVDLAGVFRSAVERAGLTLELDCPAHPVPVLADPNHLEQVILNLLSNALKFTFDGTITVRVSERAGHGIVEVADTGIGISEENLERLFERFHRVRDERSRSHEGSGIGLALSKELVELQGGTIEVVSRKEAGTTFTVSLPSAPAAEELIRPEASSQAEAFVAEALRWSDETDGPWPETRDDGHEYRLDEESSGAEARVLVVDDNADMRDYLRRLLAERYEVLLATDGEQALTLLRTGSPVDLVLSDVMMPRCNGFELLRALRADQALSGIPVVLLSARAGEEASVEGLDAGADDYVVKPFASRELLARVAANLELGALRNREAQRSAEYAERLEGLLDREHAIAVTLQRSLLPGELEVGAFTRVGAHYEPAGQTMQVGGDFYDALALPDGRVLLFIGDVAGHGLESAVVMGAMRAALNAYVLGDPAPAALLADLNTFALARSVTPMVTCQCVIIDADGRGATYATAGHPPGLVRHATGTVELLDDAPGPALGIQPLSRFSEAHVALEPGSEIVLYTDGLIERRDEPLDAGLHRLVEHITARQVSDPRTRAEQLVNGQRNGDFPDDVAVLVATLDAPGDEFSVELPAQLQTLHRLRSILRRWLAAHAVPAVDAYDIVFAVNEAASNVIEHAYALRRGSIRVRLQADAGEIAVAVADTGHWRGPRAPDGGGRGLALMEAVMDGVELEREETGSTVRMVKRRHAQETAP